MFRKRLFLPPLTAFALLVLTAAPAAAGEWVIRRGDLVSGSPPDSAPCITVHYAGSPRARACFAKRYDVLWVNDLRADGYRAGAIFNIETPEGREGVCYHDYGASAYWAWAKCDMDFNESSELLLAASFCNQDDTNRCTGPDAPLAWSAARSGWSGPHSID